MVGILARRHKASGDVRDCLEERREKTQMRPYLAILEYRRLREI
jgi:hypothetical protein